MTVKVLYKNDTQGLMTDIISIEFIADDDEWEFEQKNDNLFKRKNISQIFIKL